jgi:large conductance mechanosensitive channel
VRGFKRFLTQSSLVTTAVGLVVALALSTVVKAFTTDVITPLVNAAEGGHGATAGLGFTVGGQRILLGSFVGSVIYFVIFMLVVYAAIVVPYRRLMKRRGQDVFGEPSPTKTCPECLASDLPVAARRCRYCGSVLAEQAT